MTTLTTHPLPVESDGPAALGTPPQSPRTPSRLEGFLRGRPADPAWARPALFGLLLGTALLYIWGLGASGWANSFYSAAVQAGTKSWEAFFFGSSDASNFITVDKPPASLWVMELSARIFGLNAWSVLVPQALEGVAAVGLLYATVRRWFSPAAGLIAGAVMALTPVAVLMFRFNNPDALLVLLLVGAAYAVTRALERGRTSWLVLAAALIGTGFITKMLQAFLVVPVFAAVFLLAAPTSFWARIRSLLAAGLALIVASGWWVAVVSVVPASHRPYIGGSQHNSVLELALGYNGLGRITGNETGSVVGGGGAGNGGGMWGSTGWGRLFGSDMGGQVAWLLPAALVLMTYVLWLTRRTPRTNRTRSAVLLWGGWLVVTAATFSFMKGIIHPYYTVALAPAIGALVGIGGATLWRVRAFPSARFVAAGTVALSAWWSWTLLGRTPAWHPALREAVLIGGIVTALALLVGPRIPKLAAVAAGASLVVVLAGPTAYALSTASTPHTGSIPSAGPSGQGNGFGPGGRGGGPGGFGQRFGGQQGQTQGQGQQGRGTPPGGVGQGQAPGGTQGQAQPQGQVQGRAGGAGGASGLLNAGTPSAALVTLLQQGSDGYRWTAAAVGSNSAAGIQLGSGEPVMAIGGFNGSDNAPSLAQFKAWVAAHDVHYFIASGGGGGFGNQQGGSNVSSEITSWVEANFTAQTVGGTTVYDLSGTPSTT